MSEFKPNQTLVDIATGRKKLGPFLGSAKKYTPPASIEKRVIEMLNSGKYEGTNHIAMIAGVHRNAAAKNCQKNGIEIQYSKKYLAGFGKHHA